MGARALYYPFIRPRDEDALKRAALLWDEIARIVPPNYAVADSPTARLLADEGILHALNPVDAISPVARDFLGLLADHGKSLRSAYRLTAEEREGLDGSRGRLVARGEHGPRHGGSATVAWIHALKISPSVVEELKRWDIAVEATDAHTGHSWIGMRESLVKVYMGALAGSVARKSGLDAITDDTDASVFNAGWPKEELLYALQPHSRVARERDSTAQLAICAIEVVAPDVRNISVEDILELRRDAAIPLARFRTRLDELGSVLAHELDGVEGEENTNRVIRDVHDQHIAVDVADLRDALRAHNMNSVTALVGLQVTIETGSVAALLTSNGMPLLGCGAAGVLAVGAIGQRLLSGRNAARRDSPASYLLQVERLTSSRP